MANEQNNLNNAFEAIGEHAKTILKHTQPASDNPKVSFPDYCTQGRIRLSGFRMLEWAGNEWNAYIKDGVRWEQEDLNDDDYRILQDTLVNEIKH